MAMGEDWTDVYESDRDFIHDAASKGVTLDGKRLPRETDDDGRVWVKCRCGEKFLVDESDPKP
jgi:hypothetical protein